MSADQWNESEATPGAETEVSPGNPAPEEPQVAGTPAEESPAEETAIVEEAPPVTIAPSEDVDIEYPLVVSVANHEDIVFEDENATADVPPEVAEQVTYLTAVEVVKEETE